MGRRPPPPHEPNAAGPLPPRVGGSHRALGRYKKFTVGSVYPRMPVEAGGQGKIVTDRGPTAGALKTTTLSNVVPHSGGAAAATWQATVKIMPITDGKICFAMVGRVASPYDCCDRYARSRGVAGRCAA